MACTLAGPPPMRPSFPRSLSTPDVPASACASAASALLCADPAAADGPALDLEAFMARPGRRRRNSSLRSSAETPAELGMSSEAGRPLRRSNELTVPGGAAEPNGSLISFGNVEFMRFDSPLHRRRGADEAEQDSQADGDGPPLPAGALELRRHLLSLQTVGRTLQKTHSHLKRTRLLHVFYVLALPLYTLIGATIFHVGAGPKTPKF